MTTTTAHDLIIDQFAPTIESDKRLTTWYAQGHSDGLGDRLLMFDNTSAPSWEILRFKQALACNARFDAALRQRVEQLSSFRHPGFPQVRPIKELGHEDSLAVVSTYASGACLSEALKKPRSAEFAVRLIHQLVPALTALQEHAPDIAHGALNADRIVLTSEGRLMIREHMVGSALESLDLSAAELWADFGILASPTRTTAPALDGRSDVIQLALVALSLMAGRRIGPDEYPDRVHELLDELATRSWREPVTFQSLRHWLERALQLDDHAFESAREANDALAEWREEPERGDGYLEATLRHASEVAAGPLPDLIAPTRVVANEDPQPPTRGAVVGSGAVKEDQTERASGSVSLARRRVASAIRWAAIAVGVVAVGGAVFIGRSSYPGAAAGPAVGATVSIAPAALRADGVSSDQLVRVTPLQLKVGPPMQSRPVLPAVVVANADRRASEVRTAADEREIVANVNGRPASPVQAPAASSRDGGVRVSSPIEVHLLDGDRVLGSSEDGPIIVPAGRHEFEFVNSMVGYRARRVVDVKAGQITPLSIPVPNGTLNINALPWAAVWIDGNPLGETPLGNLSVVPGEHEIVFRHPQLGERREKALVRAGVPTRVAVNLQP